MPHRLIHGNPNPLSSRAVNVAALVSRTGAFARVAYANRDQIPDAHLALVICDRKSDAYDYFRTETDVPVVLVDYSLHAERDTAERSIVDACHDHDIDVLFLTFRRLIGSVLLNAFPDRIYNLHPALLPMFPGLNGIQETYEHGTLFAGATVHLVDADMDSGPIASQVVISRDPAESERDFTHRIFQHGAALYVDAIGKVSRSTARTGGSRVLFENARYGTQPFNPDLDIDFDSLRFPQPRP